MTKKQAENIITAVNEILEEINTARKEKDANARGKKIADIDIVHGELPIILKEGSK